MEEKGIRGERAEVPGETSGWVTTAVAARALGVTPRMVRTYIDQGRLEASSHGQGVRRSWLVSASSLQALKDARGSSEHGRRNTRGPSRAEGNTAEELFLEITNRLEVRSAEVGELRVRLALAERTRDILEEERRRLAEELKREQQERLAARREAERLAAELEESQGEVRQLRAELEQSRGFFRRRLSGG